MLNLPKSLQMRLCCDSDQGFMLSLYRSTRSDLLDMAAEPVLIEQLIVMQWQMQRQVHVCNGGPGSGEISKRLSSVGVRSTINELECNHCQAQVVF